MTQRDDRDLLRATPMWLEVMTAGLTPAQWRQRPAEGQWSPLEIVGHLVDIETDLYGAWARRVAGEAGDAPVQTAYTGFDAERLVRERAHNEADPGDLLARFAAERQRTLESLGAEPRWRRPWRVGEQNGDLRGLLRRFANHDAIHLGQLAKARRSLRAYG